MKQTTAVISRLREIVSQESWNEDALVDWAGELLAAHDHDFWEQVSEKRGRQQYEYLSKLKPQVVPYRHDTALPALPRSPHGQLHGIGFIYDEDRDDRVLIAIDDLRRNGNIVAVGEHEGELTIFTRNGGVAQRSIEVYGDTWIIRLFVPSNGCWCEVKYQHLMFDLSEFQE